MNLSFRYRWRLAIGESSLPSTARLVAHTLALYMNDEGGSCFPSLPTIAAKSGLSEKAIRLNLAELEREKYLDIERGRGRHKTHNYQARLPENRNAVPVLTSRDDEITGNSSRENWNLVHEKPEAGSTNNDIEHDKKTKEKLKADAAKLRALRHSMQEIAVKKSIGGSCVEEPVEREPADLAG